MSTRSDRARRRAAKLRNQRIILVIIVLLVVAGAGYLAWSALGRGEPTSSADMITTASGLKYQDTIVGTGAEATTGSTVSVQYTGWLENGAQFDSSKTRGQPFSFTLGQGRVIAGWEEGVVGMREGGTRILLIPPDLGYGSAGIPGTIPGNATLRFEVELLDVQ